MVMETSTEPVHFRDKEGKWQPLGLDLKADGADAYISQAGSFEARFFHRNQQNRVRLTLPKGQVFEMGLDEEIPDALGEQVRGKRAGFGAIASGHMVSYKEGRGHLDYEYEVRPNGIKELIKLNRYTGKSEFVFPLNLEGLEVQEEGDGGYCLVDPKTGNTQARIPPPVAYDAAGDQPPLIQQAVISTGTGPALWLSVDRAWLEAKETRYPVIIDPSLVIVPEGPDFMRATIYNGSATKQDTLEVFYDRGALLKFNITSIPQGSFISSASLSTSCTACLNGETTVHGVTQEWYPPFVTWTSPRGSGTFWPAGGAYDPGSYGRLDFGAVSIKGLVQDWVNGTRPNYGVTFRRSTATGGVGGISNVTLQVVYARDVVSPEVALTGVTHGSIYTQPVTVTVKATDTAPGAIGRLSLLVDGTEVEHRSRPGATTSFTLEPRRFGAGAHQIRAEVYDFAGNQAVSGEVEIVFDIPPSPSSLMAQSTDAGVELAWTAPVTADPVTYNIYRVTSSKTIPAPPDRIAQGITGTAYTDATPGMPLAESYYYAVSTVASNGVESKADAASVHFPMALDQRPLVEQLTYDQYRVSWLPSQRSGVTYSLYHGTSPDFELTSANRVANRIVATEFIDQQVNTVENGSFESDLLEWTLLAGTVDTTRSRHGSKSLKYAVTSPGSTQLVTATAKSYHNVPFTVSASVKTENLVGTEAYLQVLLWDYGGSFRGVYRLPFTLGTHDWEEKSLTITTAGGVTDNLRVEISLGLVASSGTIWYDAIQIQKGTLATPYREYVKPGSPSYYRVTAVDGTLESAPSPTSLPVGYLEPVSQLNVKSLGGGLVKLSWPSSTLSGATYSVHRRGLTTANPDASNRITSGLTIAEFVDGLNKVANAGFEQHTSGTPQVWTIACGPSCPKVEAGGNDSPQSLRIARTATTSGDQLATQELYLYQGTATPVTVSAYSRADQITAGAAGEYALWVRFYDASGIEMGSSTVDFTAGTHDWERQSVTYVPPRPIARASLTLKLGGARTGTAWFDAVQAEDGRSPSAWQDGKPVSSAQYYAIRTVDPTGVSASTNWYYGPTSGGVPTPASITVRDTGGPGVSVTWKAVEGVQYAVERATSHQYNPFARVATGVTTGLHRDQTNILPNSSFEEDTNYDYVPDGWIFTGSYGMTSTASSGTRSLYLYRGSSTEPQSRGTVTVPLDQNHALPLTLSANIWVNCSGGTSTGTDARLTLTLWDAQGYIGTGVANGPAGCTSQWQRTAVTVTPSRPAQRAEVTLELNGAFSGSAYFDQVQLEGGNSATTWTDGLLDGGTYSYRVLPFDANGNAGAPSDPVQVTTSSRPFPVTSEMINARADGQIELSWTPSVTSGSTYAVYRMTGDRSPGPEEMVAFGLVSPTYVDPANLLSNSSFEQDQNSDGLPDSWARGPVATGTSLDKVQSKSGKSSLKLVRSSSAAAAQGITQTVDLRQAEAAPVTLSGWSMATSMTGAGASDYGLTVRLLDTAGNTVGEGSIGFSPGSHGWELRSQTITPTAPAQRAEIEVRLQGNAIGTAWFDSIQLQPGPAATAWTEGPVAPGGTYFYRIATVSALGREVHSPRTVSVRSQPWPLARTQGDPPGLGLDDRWAFTDMPVPGGSAYLNLTTGNLVLLATDSVIPGPHLAQVFRRTYNSMAPAVSGAFGSGGWTLNMVQRLQQDHETGTVTLVEGDGSELRFTRNPDGSYTAPVAVWMTLTATGGEYAWQISRRDGVVYQFDSSGRMRRLSEPNGNAIELVYGANGTLTEVRGPSSRRASLSYDASGRLAQLTDGADRQYAYGYDQQGRLQMYTDPLGLSITYTYNPNGRIATIEDAGGRSVLFTYDGSGRLATYQWQGDPGRTTFAYTADGPDRNNALITDPVGNVAKLVTNGTGNLIEGIDALANRTTFDYDECQRLIRLTNPRGQTTEVKYETGSPSPRVSEVTVRGEVTAVTKIENYAAFDKPGLVTNPLGTKTKYTYDLKGNLLSQTVGFGTAQAATMTNKYRSDGMLLTVTDPLGRTSTYETDALGQVTAVINPAGGKSSLRYDAAGNLVVSIDASHYETRYTYDILGRRLMTYYPDGGVASWTYDPSGLVTETTVPGGVRTTYQYDTAGRPVSVLDNQGNKTRFEYDAAGNQTKVFNPNGSIVRLEYDALGRVIRSYDGENLTNTGEPASWAVWTEYAYDAVGSPIRTKLPSGFTISTEYDLFNRPVKETVGTSVTRYTYDVMGNLLTKQDANGKWTRYAYNGLSQLTQVYDAANLTSAGVTKSGAVYTSYTYDLAGSLTSVKTPGGRTTTYAYNALGLVSRETDPAGQVIANEYDQAGRLVSRFDRNGSYTSHDYDSMGRVLTTRYQDDCFGTAFTYDAGGRLLHTRSRAGTVSYRYDELGRLAEEQANNQYVRYRYDAMGLRTAVEMPEGTLTYDYDRANRLSSVTDLNGKTVTYKYNVDGQVVEVSLPDGITQTNTYDPVTHRMARLQYAFKGGGQYSFDYQYDPLGNIRSVVTTEQAAGASSSKSSGQVYFYDDVNRLQYVHSAMPSNIYGNYVGYLYDADGNRVREEQGSFEKKSDAVFQRTPDTARYTTHQYSGAGWLLKSISVAPNGGGSETLYSYDGEGNLLQQSSTTGRIETYTYDSRGLPLKVQVSGLNQKQFIYNEYDALGRRIRRRTTTQGGGAEILESVSLFQYDGVFVLSERDGSSSLRTVYTREPNTGRLLTWAKPQEARSGARSGTFLVDHLGSVRMMVGSDGSGNVYDYDVFGKVTYSSETIQNDVKYTGGLQDGSGLYHLYSRFYNPGVGRFITQDTYKGSVWEPWTQNLYVYVGNNPVNFTDPTGHACKAVDDSARDCAADDLAEGEPTVVQLSDGSKVVVHEDGRVFQVDTDGNQVELKAEQDSSGNWVLSHPFSSFTVLLGVGMALSNGPPAVVGNDRSLSRNTLAVVFWKGSGVVMSIGSGIWAEQLDAAVSKGIGALNDALVAGATWIRESLTSE
jgi:RHS repeat-associated protein